MCAFRLFEAFLSFPVSSRSSVKSAGVPNGRFSVDAHCCTLLMRLIFYSPCSVCGIRGSCATRSVPAAVDIFSICRVGARQAHLMQVSVRALELGIHMELDVEGNNYTESVTAGQVEVGRPSQAVM